MRPVGPFVAAAAESPAALPWGLAWRLAFGQLVAWGILYYAFTVVVSPMQADTGWSRPFLNSGLSLGLLTWGVCAVPVGAWIQRRGGRGIMALASLLGGGALVMMGLTTQPLAYQFAWVMLGAAMAGMLYDAAFAVVTAAFGPHYRRGITLITLVGGLASTAFIPLAQFLIDRLGWRHGLVTLGGLQALVGVPLHLWRMPAPPARPISLADTPVASARQKFAGWVREFLHDVGDPRFVGLALWFTAHAAAFTGLIFQLVPILQASGVPNATMLQAIAIIGPMQVLGRALLTTRGDHFSTLAVGRWAMGGLAVAVAILLLAPPRFGWLATFAVLFGAANGVLTIVRGTAIAELFGRERYAELNGALSVPAVLAKAAAPLALAGAWSMTGRTWVVFAGVLACVLLGSLGLEHAARAQRRRAARTGVSAG